MDILSISFDHDASACLLRDGKIVFYLKEERLSRVKRDASPFSIIAALKEHQIEEVDILVFHTVENVDLDKIDLKNVNCSKITWCQEFLKKQLKYKQKINWSDLKHHDTHANLAFYNSGFDESLVFVADRSGSFINFDHPFGQGQTWETESLYHFKQDSNFKKVLLKNFGALEFSSDDKFAFCEINNVFDNDVEVNLSFGITRLYSSACGLMGMDIFNAGKAMGLSSYGEKDIFKYYGDSIKNISFDYKDDPSSKFITKQLDCRAPHDIPVHLRITKEITKENYRYYANYCKYVQEVSQNVVVDIISKYVNKTGIKKVCLSGGYANNIVTNAYLKKNLPHVDFYFEPVCDDSGNSIGAAYDVYTNLSPTNRISPPKTNFYISYAKESLSDKRATSTSIDEILDLFLQQKTIAIFEGSPEAGQRALGHRSIIFDARNLNGQGIVNKTKKREWYRPFAGVVRKEDFKDYFFCNGFEESPNMMINFDAKVHTCNEFPSIIHVDNTCRIQTVTNGFFYEFITLLKEKTSCPIILNTSFNLAGEPLVHTVKDAIDTFDNSELDVLYFVDENKLLKKL